jgi:hypothetical protein
MTRTKAATPLEAAPSVKIEPTIRNIKEQKRQSPSGLMGREGLRRVGTVVRTYAHPSGPRKLESHRLE